MSITPVITAVDLAATNEAAAEAAVVSAASAAGTATTEELPRATTPGTPALEKPSFAGDQKSGAKRREKKVEEEMVTWIEKGSQGYGFLVVKRERMDRLQVAGFADIPLNPATVCDPPLAKGDVLQKINGEQVTSFDHTVKLLKKAEGHVQLTIEREVAEVVVASSSDGTTAA